MNPGNPQQKELPFVMAQAAKDELYSKLCLALQRVKAKLPLARICFWIFNRNYSDKYPGELDLDYKKIAETPRGLCCSPRLAERLILSSEQQGFSEHSRGVLLRIGIQTAFREGQLGGGLSPHWHAFRSHPMAA